MKKNKYKVFVLENSATQRNLIAQCIKQDDREIIVAESITEAKDVYNKNISGINLFILNLELPDGDGIDFLKYVSKTSEFVPSIIVSASISQKNKDIAEKLWVVSFFEKPIDFSYLNNIVKIILPEKSSIEQQFGSMY